jgi:hypothetical protein
MVKVKPLTVDFVFSQLKTIATTTGHQVCSYIYVLRLSWNFL